MVPGERKTSRRIGTKTANYGKADKETFYDSTERYPLSVQRFGSRIDGAALHPTQKPIALMEYLIRTYTNEGDTVLDNTMGSGTTGVACMNTGRQFIGIERDPDYFDIACRRIEKAYSQGDLFVAPPANDNVPPMPDLFGAA